MDISLKNLNFTKASQVKKKWVIQVDDIHFLITCPICLNWNYRTIDRKIKTWKLPVISVQINENLLNFQSVLSFKFTRI